MSMNKEIYILGVGHNTIVTIDLAESCGYCVMGLYHYLGDRTNENYFGHQIIGSNKELFSLDLSEKNFAISVGNNDIRAELFYRIKQCGGKVVTLIHPTAVVSKYSNIEKGVHIYANSIVDPDTIIGENSIVSSKSSVLHGCCIGRHCFLAPDVVLGANTTVEDYAFIGLNATIISNKVNLIDKHAVVGASAVVTKPVGKNQLVVGMPAKELQIEDNSKNNSYNNQTDKYIDVSDLIEGQAFKDLYGKKLLVLAGADVHIKIVKAAKELGVYTIVTDNLNPQSSPAKQMADEYWMLSITDVDAIVNKCRQEKIDGVLAFCIDPAQIPYQQICEKLGVPCYGTREQFEILTNKRLFKDYCTVHGIGVIPEYDMADVENDKVVYPVLVKPSDSRGSRGQSVCYSKNEIHAAVEYARTESKDGGVLIERYMLGKQDMSFSYIIINGVPYLLKIGDRHLGLVEDNLERQHIATILPSRNAEQYRRNVEPNVIRMIKSLGITYGAVFLQGFWEDGHIYMYDPGMRFPGGDFDIVLKHATGFDNMKSFVRFALTGDINSQQGSPINAYKLNGGICIILSVAARAGKIAVFSGFEKIASNSHVFSISQRYNVGDIVPSSGDIKQRVAEFVAYLPDKDSISEFLSFIYNNLKVIDDEGNDMIISKLKI